jgi:formylglycine-generating enzyme required for sulfatase activity/energy-coupling factor transporter ATP-binding protein EcfA2
MADAGLLTRTTSRPRFRPGRKPTATPGLVAGSDDLAKVLAWQSPECFYPMKDRHLSSTGGKMEPTTVVSTAIIAAISAGVTGGVTAVGRQAIVDAYEALKKGIKAKIGKKSKSAKAIQELEEDPDSKGWQALLAEKVQTENVGDHSELVHVARELIKALDESEAGRHALAKYQVDAKGAMIGILGDHGTIQGGYHQHFHQPPTQQEDSPEEGLEDFYLQTLIGKCDKLDLTPFEEICSQDGKGGSPIQVSDVFTTLYLKDVERFEGQSVAQAILRPIGDREDLKRSREEQERFPIKAIEAAGALNRLVILGRPGGGKSTLVNHLSTQAAHLRMGAAVDRDDLTGWPREEKRLPVRIVLRRFAAWIPDKCKEGTAGLVWDYLAHQLQELGCGEFHAPLKHILTTDGGVIFFDGLDEVREADERKKRSLIVHSIADFALPLNNCRVVITCREYAYTKDDAWRLPEAQFPVVELSLFRSEQIKQFTRTWYRIVGKWRDWSAQKCDAEAENLFQAIESRSHLNELGQYPLLLTLMAQVHGRDGYLPDDRADLYERAVKLLLVHWETRIIRDPDGTCKLEQGLIARLGVPTDKLRAILEQIALAAHEQQEKDQDATRCADIPREDLRQALSDGLKIGLDKAEAVIAYIQNRAGLLQAEDNRIFRFPHRTFQEYLAAVCSMKEDAFEEFLSIRVQRDISWWQEVFLLAAGSSRNTPRTIYMLVDALLPEDPKDSPLSPEAVACARLSAQAMAETGFCTYVDKQAASPGRYTKIHKRVQGWLLAALTADDTLTPKQCVDAGNALNWVGDPRFDPKQWYLPNEEGLGFITVPAGAFWMGSDKAKDEEADDVELPRHRVELSEYQIARYPVTAAQYRVFADEQGLELDEDNRFDNHPVVGVSWDDAQRYCQWLTDKLKGHGWDAMVALPTEAQWEKAARFPDDRIYPWDVDSIEPNRANYDDTGIYSTSPVGCFPGGASHLELTDLAENVWEWCRDWYDEAYYAKSPAHDPEGPSDGAYRVIRGGSFHDPAWHCRSAARDGHEPGVRVNNLGFRLVLLPGQPG